jgi:hypothetical protein
MLLLLIATLAGNWNYEGFVSDPAQPGPVKPESVKPESGVPVPLGTVMPSLAIVPAPPMTPASTVEIDPSPLVAACPSSVPTSLLPKTIEAKSPSRPKRWRLTDFAGQVWEHADREWLFCWITYRNARLAVPRAAPRYELDAPWLEGTCTTGRCKRAR